MQQIDEARALKVIVVGAGTLRAFAAIALRSQGHHVHVGLSKFLVDHQVTKSFSRYLNLQVSRANLVLVSPCRPTLYALSEV